MEADALTLRTAAGSRCTPGRTLSAATWNIHGAVGGDRRYVPKRIFDVLSELGADVVALQEVPLQGAHGNFLVELEHATGYQTTSNVAVYNARFYEGRAVIGTMAGMMSKSGVVGYIGSFPIPEVVMGINAFTLAAQKINPNIQTKVVW